MFSTDQALILSISMGKGFYFYFYFTSIKDKCILMAYFKLQLDDPYWRPELNSNLPFAEIQDYTRYLQVLHFIFTVCWLGQISIKYIGDDPQKFWLS